MRCHEMKNLLKEGKALEEDYCYFIISGECLAYKTRNEFKIYDEYGNEKTKSTKKKTDQTYTENAYSPDIIDKESRNFS